MSRKRPHRRRKSEFSTDRPIDSSRADRLGRSSFAKGLAQRIGTWNGKDSLVIALCGEWGCGKTSLKNLVLEDLGRRSVKRVDLLEFNPWQISGHDAVASAFFRELSVVLDKSEDDAATIEKRVTKLRVYAKLATLGGSAAKWITKGLDAAGYEHGSAVETAGQVVEMIGNAIGGIGEATNQAADANEARGKRKELSLSELKRSLTEDMADLPRPILIVIDDIDRLTHDEIREVFQLVKANADFPNLIYLLMFDREIVGSALNTISGGRGDEYLDKIVQVLFHVPQPPLASVRQVLFEGLDVLLTDPGVMERWDTKRWSSVWLDGLAQYFTNLRNIYRFLGSFGFQVSQMRNGQTFELNPIDLVVLETLRLFESKFYESIPANHGLLTEANHGLFSRDDSEAKQKKIDEFERLLSTTVLDTHRARVTNIAKHLFPATFGHRHPSEELMLRDLRVGQSVIFHRYFTLSLVVDDISQADLDTIRRSLNRPGTLVDTCANLQRRGLLETAFERLDCYKESLPPNLFPEMVTALSEVGDFLPKDDRVDIGKFDSLTHAWRLVYFGLQQINDEEQRFQLLKAGIQPSRGVRLAVKIASHEERRPGENEHSYLVGADHFHELRDLAADRIRKAAGDGRLQKIPGLRYVLYRWREWTSQDEVSGWLSQHNKRPEDALWMLQTFLSVMQSYENRVQITRYIRLDELEKFADINRLETHTRSINIGQLEQNDQRALRAFRQALVWRSEGKADGYGQDAWHNGKNPLTEEL